VGEGSGQITEGKQPVLVEEQVDRLRPEVLGRPSWEIEEAGKDELLLRWVGRFRFVTAELVARRFGVSVQRARARLRRLEGVGMMGAEQRFRSEARAYFVSAKGAAELGLPRRRRPRVDVQRAHELLIVGLAVDLELRGCQVLSERDCRACEATNAGRFSVEAHGGRQHERRHWPDLVLMGSRAGALGDRGRADRQSAQAP
jgi:hypothetical protein